MPGTKIFARDQDIFKIEIVRDKERIIAWGHINIQGTEVFVQDREKFEIEGSRDRESPM